MIIYAGPTAKSETDNVRAFVEYAIGAELIYLHPHGTCRTGDLYRLYTSHPRFAPHLDIRRFGMALGRLGSPAVKGTSGVRLRGGIRLVH